MVHQTALGDDLPDVLGWKRATALIAQAHTLALHRCYCRYKASHLGRASDASIDNYPSMNAGAVPASMRARAGALGVDVERTAETGRSLTIRARKPAVGA